MSDQPEFIKITVNLSNMYPPEVVRKVSKGIRNLTIGISRKMGLGEFVKSVLIDEKSEKTYYHSLDKSIHFGESLIRGILTLELDSAAREDYFNWIWVDPDPKVYHSGYKLCNCQWKPQWLSRLPIERRHIATDLHLALIICHELTHAFCEMMAYHLVPCGTGGTSPSSNTGEVFVYNQPYDPHDDRFRDAFMELWRVHGAAIEKGVWKIHEDALESE